MPTGVFQTKTKRPNEVLLWEISFADLLQNEAGKPTDALVSGNVLVEVLSATPVLLLDAEVGINQDAILRLIPEGAGPVDHLFDVHSFERIILTGVSPDPQATETPFIVPDSLSVANPVVKFKTQGGAHGENVYITVKTGSTTCSAKYERVVLMQVRNS
jgi:hypothetical protein